MNSLRKIIYQINHLGVTFAKYKLPFLAIFDEVSATRVLMKTAFLILIYQYIKPYTP